MLSIVTNIHKNILSANCSIKCNLQNSTISNIKVTCSKTDLSVNFFNDTELLHSIKILTPENFFIPSSVSKKASLHEKIELINDILTISRSCPELKIANSTLPINYPSNESTHNCEENNCGSDCKERVDFTDIFNNSSSIIEEKKLTSKENISNTSCEDQVDFSDVGNYSSLHTDGKEYRTSSSIIDENELTHKSVENINNPSREAHVDFSAVENNSSSLTDKNAKKRKKEENTSEPSCVDKENVSGPSREEPIGDIEAKSYLSAENNVEINFRIQISNGDLIAACSTLSPWVPPLFKFFEKQIQVNQDYIVCCTNCGIQLSETPVSFENLKEYSYREDFSEEFFCHSQKLPLSPHLNEETLYFNVRGMYLYRGISESFLTEEVCEKIPPKGGDSDAKNSEPDSDDEFDDSRVRSKSIRHCKACFTALTIATFRDFTLFYPEAIMFKKLSSQHSSHDGYLQKFVMFSLWTIIYDAYWPLNGKSVSKIIFECYCAESVEAILMFVPPTRIAQFHLQSTLLDLPPEVEFTTSRVYKVMFHIATLPSPHVDLWRKDFYSECYKVGSPFFSTLKKILLSSVEIMRTDNELHGDFMTGCLSFNNLDLELPKRVVRLGFSPPRILKRELPGSGSSVADYIF